MFVLRKLLSTQWLHVYGVAIDRHVGVVLVDVNGDDVVLPAASIILDVFFCDTLRFNPFPLRNYFTSSII